MGPGMRATHLLGDPEVANDPVLEAALLRAELRRLQSDAHRGIGPQGGDGGGAEGRVVHYSREGVDPTHNARFLRERSWDVRCLRRDSTPAARERVHDRMKEVKSELFGAPTGEPEMAHDHFVRHARVRTKRVHR
eukprot:7083679-Prymnesium_polylepis.1